MSDVSAQTTATARKRRKSKAENIPVPLGTSSRESASRSQRAALIPPASPQKGDTCVRKDTKESNRDHEQFKRALPGEENELRTFILEGRKPHDSLFLIVRCDSLALVLVKKTQL